MSKTKIEWTDYTLNPVKGKCPMACDYCYARRMYERFHWNPELRFVPTVFNDLPTKPARIFVGSTIELFLPQFNAWLEKIFDLIKPYKWLTFQFLTKCPENLIKFSPFPENCWVGVTVTDQEFLNDALLHLIGVDAKVKFLSFEPLLGEIGVSFNERGLSFPNGEIQWVIIGAQTKPYKPPKIEWVEEIVRACDKAGVPVFLKDNLWPIKELKYLRREFP